MTITPSNHLGHLYYGPKLTEPIDPSVFNPIHPLEFGSQVVYDESIPKYSLNLQLMEFSSFGKGDFREPTVEMKFADGSTLFDCRYDSCEIFEGPHPSLDLPDSRSHLEYPSQTILIRLKDTIQNLTVLLYYTVFPHSDVLTRRMELCNHSSHPMIIKKAMSLHLDFLDDDYEVITLNGTWIRERHPHQFALNPGVFSIDSKKGVSSSDHNPSFILKRKNTTETTGFALGASLIWSGNFKASFEVTPHHLTRILLGLNPFEFEYTLEKDGVFSTPTAVLSLSIDGLAKLSHHFHHYVNHHIVSPYWANKTRPIAINNWEATYFDFTEERLLKLARKAKKLGIELFVLDDGWFGLRNDDTSSLGDWVSNPKKLPHGLASFANRIRQIGLEFGIWVEPEMVSPNSKLFRKNPHWVVQHPNTAPSLGRHQLVLDLTNPDVCDYLVSAITNVLKESKAAYCKWDMNRNLSDVYSSFLPAFRQGEFQYRYVRGLYSILERLTKLFPDVLFESCASGGNRFDLGMLYYMPQTWTSDNTDALERTKIQYGTSFFYPPSTISNHVSASPNAQVLRSTSIETRFQVAMFGVLGYELDLNRLPKFDLDAIKEQVKFYKQHRDTLQFGTFSRLNNPLKDNEFLWYVENPTNFYGLLLLFQTLQQANPGLKRIQLPYVGFAGMYRIQNRQIHHNLRMFGDLIKHALPIPLKAHSSLFNLLANRYRLVGEKKEMVQDQASIQSFGFLPSPSYQGTGYHQEQRLMGDFGSRIYLFEPIHKEEL